MKEGSQEDLVINLKITCTNSNIIYFISCTKQSGVCAKVHPQYIGKTGKSAKEKCAMNIGTTTKHSQTGTTLPMGVYFWLPGHSHSDLQFLPIEKDPHVWRVREMTSRSLKL